MLRLGKTMEEIKELAAGENIFSAATPLRSGQIFSTVSARVSVLPDDYHNLFTESSLETQKLITLIAIMKTDTLFFDFLNDVFREKLITGDLVLKDADIRVFFWNKQRDSEKVAVWTDATLERLLGCYKTYLFEAGLLERGKGERKIIKPLLDQKLERLLSDRGSIQILKILTGKR